jgi:hypothetical protein
MESSTKSAPVGGESPKVDKPSSREDYAETPSPQPK